MGGLKYLHSRCLNRQREDRREELQRLVVAQVTWSRGLVLELLKHLHGNGKDGLREQFSRAMARFRLCRRSACRADEHVGVDKAQGCYSPTCTWGLGAANPQIWVDRVDPALLDGLIRATAAADTWNCPTLVLWHRQQNPNREPESELAPLLRFVPARMLEGWISANARSASVRVNHERATSIRRVLTKALHDAGAGLLLGTDAPNPFVVYGFSIHDELDQLVEAGLSPFEALRAGTSAAAKYLGTHLGYGSNFGTIAVGERADLILTQENPIQNLRTLRNNDGVMLRGRWLSRSELSDKLKDLTQTIAFADQLIREAS